ncbi:MAG: hypothetical protein NZ942_02140, partial [Candidatus Aenigmarchaeota archaeon]|nr:hypothetical protein [Candidatus Aenigmarchaeota archaeon]
ALQQPRRIIGFSNQKYENLPEITVEENIRKTGKKYEILREIIEILEKERKEGIISLASYTEMKKSIEEKLEKIEKKLK